MGQLVVLLLLAAGLGMGGVAWTAHRAPGTDGTTGPARAGEAAGVGCADAGERLDPAGLRRTAGMARVQDTVLVPEGTTVLRAEAGSRTPPAVPDRFPGPLPVTQRPTPMLLLANPQGGWQLARPLRVADPGARGGCVPTAYWVQAVVAARQRATAGPGPGISRHFSDTR